MAFINSPQAGSIVTRLKRDGDGNRASRYPCDVYIVKGEYLVNGKISNFWYWRRVLDNGSLAAIEGGYGKFVESDIEYNIAITITKK